MLKAFTDRRLRGIVEKALKAYIAKCGPGYNEAIRYLYEPNFISARNELAERYHQAAVAGKKSLNSDVWDSFPRAFHPFRTSNSRVNFLVHRSSAIARRSRLAGRFFRFRDVVKQLEAVANCTLIGTKGSHVQFRAKNGGRVTVPRHSGDLKRGTLSSIIRQAGLDMGIQEFMDAEPVRM